MSDEPGQEAEATPVTKTARDLTEITRLTEALEAQAVAKSNDRLMPGGLATVSLAPVANLEAWEHQYETRERIGLDHDHIQDEDDTWEPVLQTLLFWSEQWRVIHAAEYGQRPTVTSEAAFIRWALNWAWDNETHWDDFATDIRRARIRLEDLLHAGERSQRGAPCMYDECRGKRLVRKLIPSRDDATGRKTWTVTDWHCPTCHRSWNEDRYAANVAAAHERTKIEEINGETWCTVDYAARTTGRPESTLRVWIHRGELSTACMILGRRTRFVRLAEVEKRSSNRTPAA